MLPKYKSLTRTTLDKTEGLPLAGVYIFAYMGKVVYVGKATQSVVHRLETHWYNRANEAFGDWLDMMRPDWRNVRLDVLEPPDDMRAGYWMLQTEAALVRRHKPLFNTHLQT